MPRKPKIERFNEQVLSKYQIYNSIFMTLPFDEVGNTGVLLPLFRDLCTKGYAAGKNPSEITEEFFVRYVNNTEEDFRNDLLFRMIQYIERQVVLFDAVEDAAFPVVNNMDGQGTLRYVKEEAEVRHQNQELREFLKAFKIRTVLTAHPTQFYPGPVLGIITDLAQAIRVNDFTLIAKLLAQLGKTPFYNKQRPTPFEEAVSLVWFLENVFYHAVSKIYQYVQKNIFDGELLANELINLGFWPGGDRDGNPYVTSDVTLQVATRLKNALLRNYYRDIRKLKRRITFNQADELIQQLETEFYQAAFQNTESSEFSPQLALGVLAKVRQILIEQHQSLYLEEVDDFIAKLRIFGFHFASLDLRQDARVHRSVMEDIVSQGENAGSKIFPHNYWELRGSDQNKILNSVRAQLQPASFSNDLTSDTLASIYAMRSIQKENGELGSNRYVISNTSSAQNVLEVLAMFRLCDWEDPTVDIIPLFETITDLSVAEAVMEELYQNEGYAQHLRRRNNQQTIMLGFSDGTKDGGYLMANWGIYLAKEALTRISRKYQVDVLFFDGRGGPPARGGGKTHQFYASLGENIENNEIQLTIQGQTISSNFGTLDSCQYNLEQLISAGVVNDVFRSTEGELSHEDRQTMQRLAELSYQAYQDFKCHPKFMPYLEEVSTLNYYAKTNISSRPAKRGKSEKLDFADLRAIPFVGSWSQLKQNVPGFYGLGLAIETLANEGKIDQVKLLYQHSAFFRTLLENSMMSLTKSFFPLTAYLQEDPEYSGFWNLIHQEYQRSIQYILQITGYPSLMDNTKSGKASIEIRENIVLPLLTIQQYALRRIRELKQQGQRETEELATYEKMVTRSLFGNINASRNSA